MADLTTRYMGLELANPLVISSSGITGSIDGVKRCADAGAGAVVLKSMFEELLAGYALEIDHELLAAEHPEAIDYLRADLGMQIGPQPYLAFIEKAKAAASIPVIASVNCTSPRWWIHYAGQIRDAGADALELNISYFPSLEEDPRDIEQRYVDIVSNIAARVDIPVAVKLGFHFTSPARLCADLVSAGASALVLFNRFFPVDIDIRTGAFEQQTVLSAPQELLVPLRWIGYLSGKLRTDFAVTTGVMDVEGIVKSLMAGATVVQLCSTLYRNGPGYVATLREDLDRWLAGNGHSSVDNIRGKARRVDGEELLTRLQYLKALNESAKYEI